MKSFLIVILLLFSGFISNAQLRQEPDSSKKVFEVETACGQCKFGLEGKSCDLAVKIEGKALFVDGTGIDDHGDAHDEDGFCNSVRKAMVQGEIINGRFKVSYFRLLKKEN
jgi:hypothetical protein